MGIQVSDNFDHKSKKPLDARTSYTTLALMKAVTDANIYEGCIAYCAEDDKYYKFKSSNTVDETTGKWREYQSGGGGSTTLSGLTDVDLSNLTDGQILKYDAQSEKWVNGSGGSVSVAALGDIGDVNLTSIADGQIIKWDSATSKWVNANLPSVPTKTSDLTNDSGFITSSDIPAIPDDLNDLSDVNISSPTNGQVLKYNDSTEKWENSSSGGGGTTDYADLSNKPSIENVTLSGNKSASDLGLVKSSALATVATSGSYNDLSNKPSIPSSASDIGLGNVVNTGDSATPVENGTTKFTTGGAYTELEKKQRKVQYTVMPTASVDFSEIIVQYIGVTGNGYTHGYFYEAVNDNGTYSWVQTNVQPSSGGGGSYTAGDGIDITNDVISTDNLQSGDMDDIVNVLPTTHAGSEVFVSGTLTAGETSITLTSNYITTSSIIDPYTDTYGVNPTNIVVTTGQAVLTFNEQASDLGVGIGIK